MNTVKLTIELMHEDDERYPQADEPMQVDHLQDILDQLEQKGFRPIGYHLRTIKNEGNDK